jgi:SAM-dependent methyltransferase
VTSALIFALEPIVAKGLLPMLGGGAAVWTTAVAFFQLALLAGYAYAHALPGRLGTWRHAALHVGLLAAAVLLLASGWAAGWEPPARSQAVWLFARLAVSVGPVFVLLAATTPLVHRWLAATNHPQARDPYSLYVASNAGSLIALLAYPVAIEPLLGLAGQRLAWTSASFAAVALVATSALLASRRAAPAAAPVLTGATSPAAGSAAAWGQRARWMVTAAVPSSLLLSVTTYLTTDLVALPLLWVAPLALYLVTFIIAFSPRSLRSRRWALIAQPFVLLPVAAEMFIRVDAAAVALIPLHAAAFFVSALVCHQSLAASRPPADRSTEFYFWLAAGGALGGLANVFLAPLLFSGVLEYPLGLVAAALLRPTDAGSSDRRARRFDLLLPAGLAAALLVFAWAAPAIESRFGFNVRLVLLIVTLSTAGAATYAWRWRRWRFALALAAMIAAGGRYQQGGSRPVYAERSFYAVHQVMLDPPSLLKLSHGNTVHGAQDLAADRRREPLTYYHRASPIGDVMAAWQGRPQRRRVAVVGLGAGSLAAYAEPGERWTFFEIDPAVVNVARGGGSFTFLADTRGDVDVVLGDGRQSLRAVADGTYGLLVLDAFTSDAIPVHLLTREALELWLRKLAPGGVIAVHLSNRYLDLASPLAATATDLGLVARVRFHAVSDADARAMKLASHWMVIARTAGELAPLAPDTRWQAPRPGAAAWTDDASDVWRALRLYSH